MLHLELIWMESHHVRYLLIIKVKFFVGDPSKGHRGYSRSPTVFLPITWDLNEIETWDWCHCVCFRKAHRMMYNLTYLGHRVTLPWLGLSSNVYLDLSRSNYTWFHAPWPHKYDRVTIVVVSFKTKTLSSKNHFGQIWPFDLWWPQFWPELKNDRSSFRMIFTELSNAVFRFVLRRAGIEVDGGCSLFKHPPPPPSGGGKSRGPSGRGLNNIQQGHGFLSLFGCLGTPKWNWAPTIFFGHPQ